MINAFGRRALLGALIGLWANTTALDAEVVRGPYLQIPTPEGITIRWATDEPTDSRIRYGTSQDSLDRTVTVEGPRLDHAVRLTGLAGDTRYFYAVGSSAGDAGSGDCYTFATAPSAAGSGPIRIWTFGDSGRTTHRQAAVRDAFTSWAGDRRPDLFLLLGDNAYDAGTELEYNQTFFYPYREVLASTAAFSTLGNHEGLSSRRTDNVGDETAVETGPYFDLFTFPMDGEAGGVASGSEAFYSFDYGNLHVISLDSESASRDPDGPMAQWLEQDLAANTAEWTIVIFHHPVYSRGGHDSDTDELDVVVTQRVPEMRQNFLPLLEAGGVDLVLMGHSHSYERSYLLGGHYGFSDSFDPSMRLDSGDGRPDGDGPYVKTGDPDDDAHSGTVYAVVGTGESATGVSGLHPAMATFENTLGSLVVDVHGSRLDGRFLDAEQNVLDHFTILRGDANTPPVAIDDRASAATAGSVTLDLLANDYDPDDDPLAVESVSAPQLGSVTDHGDGTVTYTAPPDLPAGTDTFTYVIGDGRGLEATGTVTLAIACPPLSDGVFIDDLEPEPEAGWSVDTARNDVPTSQPWTPIEDPEASSPTHSWFSVSDIATRLKDDRLVSPPLDLSSESTLTFEHRYDFEEDFDGGSLEISLDDGCTWQDLGGSVVSGGYTGTLSDVGVFGGAPVWTGVSGEAMTSVQVDLSAFAGQDRLLRWRLRADDFTIFPPTRGWWIDDVSVDGLPGTPGDCNLAPIAVNDEAATDEGTPVNVDVLANDSDPDGDPISVLALGTPHNGTATVEPDSTVTYSPDPGFVGVDVFEYTITDGDLTATAAISIEVEDPAQTGATVKGNGDVTDAAGRARFALHVKPGLKNAWLRYRGGVEIDGDPTSLSITGQTALVEGACYTAAGDPCSFTATAFDSGQPGNAGDTFAIEIRDASGATLWEASGPVDRGGVRIR